MCWSLPQMFVVTSLRMTPCWQGLPRGSTSFGKSRFWISSFLGPTYATARLPGMPDPPRMLNYRVESLGGNPESNVRTDTPRRLEWRSQAVVANRPAQRGLRQRLPPLDL